LFDWKEKENTISATERINKLEGDKESEFKVITSTEKAGEILLHLTQSAPVGGPQNCTTATLSL
jgi:hypothetical protein